MLFIVCPSYYYGSDCNTPCGQCRGNDVCNNVTGLCPRSCQPHWQGSRCDGKIKQFSILLHLLSNGKGQN